MNSDPAPGVFTHNVYDQQRTQEHTRTQTQTHTHTHTSTHAKSTRPWLHHRPTTKNTRVHTAVHIALAVFLLCFVFCCLMCSSVPNSCGIECIPRSIHRSSVIRDNNIALAGSARRLFSDYLSDSCTVDTISTCTEAFFPSGFAYLLPPYDHGCHLRQPILLVCVGFFFAGWRYFCLVTKSAI